MYNSLNDNMKKESKLFVFLTFFGYSFSIIMPLVNYLTLDERYTITDNILFFLTFFLFGTIGLYGWLYSSTYKLEITNEKIILKTLFKRIEVNIKDIVNYTYKRYRKSVFYQFKLYTNDKKLLISTRYKDSFIEILKETKE